MNAEIKQWGILAVIGGIGAFALHAMATKTAAAQTTSDNVTPVSTPVAVAYGNVPYQPGSFSDVASLGDVQGNQEAMAALLSALSTPAPTVPASNADLFPLFGYAAGGDTINFNTINQSQQSTAPAQQSTYSPVAPAPVLITKAAPPVPTDTVFVPATGQLISVAAGSGDRIQRQADYYSALKAAEYQDAMQKRWRL